MRILNTSLSKINITSFKEDGSPNVSFMNDITLNEE